MDPAPPPEPDVEGDAKPSAVPAREARAKPPLVLLGVIAVLVGLLGGFIAGFRVEQNRVWNRNAGTKTPTFLRSSQNISRLGGLVTNAANGMITVAASTGFQVKMRLPSTLDVEQAKKGSIADVTVGASILQRSTQVSTGLHDATEVIIVPGSSKFKGLKVTAVTADKIITAQPNGVPVTLTVKSTTAFYTVDRSSANDIRRGAEIFANGRGTLGRDSFTPNAIIILIRGSAFAQQ